MILYNKIWPIRTPRIRIWHTIVGTRPSANLLFQLLAGAMSEYKIFCTIEVIATGKKPYSSGQIRTNGDSIVLFEKKIIGECV